MRGVVLDKNGDETDVVRLAAASLEEVVSPKAPVLALAFEPKTFAQRKMSVEFDERGRLTMVEQSGTSALAGMSSAAADGLTKARDAYAATLSRIAEIQDSERKIADSGILTEIGRLKKEKELLDARLDLGSAQSNYDLLLEKKQLDAQLAALQSRAAVGTNQATGTERAELEKLKAQLDLLTHELAILKAKQEFEKLSQPKQ